jgi:hypothetical protein
MERGTHCCSTTIIAAVRLWSLPITSAQHRHSHQQANKKRDLSLHHVSTVPDPRSTEPPAEFGREKKRREEEDPSQPFTGKQQHPKRAAPQPLKASSLPSRHSLDPASFLSAPSTDHPPPSSLGKAAGSRGWRSTRRCGGAATDGCAPSTPMPSTSSSGPSRSTRKLPSPAPPSHLATGRIWVDGGSVLVPRRSSGTLQIRGVWGDRGTGWDLTNSSWWWRLSRRGVRVGLLWAG